MFIIKELSLVLDSSSAFITSIDFNQETNTAAYTIGDVNQEITQSGSKAIIREQWLKFTNLIYRDPKKVKNLSQTQIVDKKLNRHKDEILDLIKNHSYNARLISYKYNVPQEYVTSWLVINEIKFINKVKTDFVKHGKKLSVDKLQDIHIMKNNLSKIRSMYSNGIPLSSLANVLGIKQHHFKSLFVNFRIVNNIPTRDRNNFVRTSSLPVNFPNCDNRDLVIINKKMINNFIGIGSTRKNICDWLKISQASFCQILKDKNIGILDIPRPNQKIKHNN